MPTRPWSTIARWWSTARFPLVPHSRAVPGDVSAVSKEVPSRFHFGGLFQHEPVSIMRTATILERRGELRDADSTYDFVLAVR
jgi:hypothetical protein